MPRYFIEVAYKGTRYSGFQIQQNANTIQAEIEKAFAVLHRRPVALTGSSRTDTGVHAAQNYFHFDDDHVNPHFVYKMNAILPDDVVIKNLHLVPDTAHCRFDAMVRSYEYSIYRFKNPFLKEVAYYFPYAIDIDVMQEAAAFIQTQTNFYTFSKAHTQVNNFNCTLQKSVWVFEKDILIYNVSGNRFLRGMVRMLTASMLKLGRGQMSFEDYKKYFTEQRKCVYAAPAQGLVLKQVIYPTNYFLRSD